MAFVLTVFQSNVAIAEAEFDFSLSIAPKQCVAINQGQVCYVDVQLTWQAPTISHYCLFSSQREQALKCWNNSNKGLFKGEIAADENVTFVLKQKKNENTLASALLEMAWVYKKNQKNKATWRMF